MFFDIRPELKEIYEIKKDKTHAFWQLYFSPKVPKEKFETICNDLMDKVEIENVLSIDFYDFSLGNKTLIGKSFFSSMKDITFCKICFIENYQTLLYEQFVSKNIKRKKIVLL